jgi:hypothetical protein
LGDNQVSSNGRPTAKENPVNKEEAIITAKKQTVVILMLNDTPIGVYSSTAKAIRARGIHESKTPAHLKGRAMMYYHMRTFIINEEAKL